MSESTQSQVDRCQSCNGEDDHPKFLVIGPTQNGLGWITYHHDCASQLGYAKASLINQHTEGAKGEDLRQFLTDPAHPVHQAVAEFSAKEDQELEATNQRVLKGDNN